MNGELLRLIDSIHRDKRIDKEIIFEGIESALAGAVRKHFETEETPEVRIDRNTGKITARTASGPVDPSILGRITAQTAKQVIIQKIKDAEGDVIFSDMETKTKDILAGSVLRFEHGHIIISIGKLEAVLPKAEQVPGESYRLGERIKALVINVKKQGAKVKITLSRTHPDFVRRLFEREVPEIADKTVEIKSVVRESGVRTKIAVASTNPKVDATGACVGVRGSRIKNVVEELNGEKIDIIQWDDDQPTYIKNSMKPVEVEAVEIDESTKRARVFVRHDQLSLAIGKKGQNIRLAAKLTGWEIDVVSSEPEKTENQESGKTPVSNPPQADKDETEEKKDEPAKSTSE